eukprot:CAMPEP_0118861344 /NCGR_PEP_ID=MMETSP1163-20130328/6908_1 /TAXON_ID=124430 /ORGANISM="Phaeomonas parva, Strain CCMP2877" /LENGTH=96 /DNA_ID=CAMNT_0006795149 /DNA_START=204 /DNA_END=494 /DNA_ORIENTATION=+
MAPRGPAQGAFAKSYIRKVMKLNEEVGNLSPEVVALTTKAVELFLEKLAKDSAKAMDGKRASLMYEDLVDARKGEPRLYEFLEEILPDMEDLAQQR